MAIVRPHHRYRGESSFSLPRLVQVVRELIPQVVPAQTRYRVTAFPTERTIRFYTSRGLVDKPLGHQGTAALYSYRHLLQVLTVKYLQAQYLPLVKVRSLMESADNRELESMLPAVAPVTAAHRGLARWDRGTPAPAYHFAGSTRPSPSPSPPPQSQPQLEPGPRGEPPADPGIRHSTAELLPGEGAERHDLWQRIEVAPGIELHVLDAALAAEQRERLRGALLREVASLRGWSGGGKQ